MLFSWFDASEAKQFGISLAEFYMERMPAKNDGRKRISDARKQEVLSKLFNQVARFKSEQKLNFYKKSQLGNAFKWTLRNAGYDHEFVDRLTLQIIMKL